MTTNQDAVQGFTTNQRLNDILGSNGVPNPNPNPKSSSQAIHSGLPLIARVEMNQDGGKYSCRFPNGINYKGLLFIAEPVGDRYAGFLVRSPWETDGYDAINGKVVPYKHYTVPDDPNELSVGVEVRKR